jgi:hypothetical protein
MVVFSYALHVTQRTESGIDDSEGTRTFSLSDSLLTAIGIACQGLSYTEVPLSLDKNFMRSARVNLGTEQIHVTLSFMCIYVSTVRILPDLYIIYKNCRNRHLSLGNHGKEM